MALQDNNPQATQDANAAYFAANPNVFGGGTTTQPTTQPTATNTQTGTTAPVLANGQTAGGLQVPTAPPTAPTGLQMPTPPTGLQMPSNGSNLVYDPTTGTQVTPAEKAFNDMKASKTPPPQNAGEVGSQVQDQINKNTPADNSKQISFVQNTLANDPGYQKLVADAKTAQTTLANSETLANQYKDLLTQYNIPGINTELINDKKIIDGTEDDIRHEVQASGGFATDSQVIALASARNKTLIQNYNSLVAQKSDLMSQINTISGLQAQDKQFAYQTANDQLKIDQQLEDYAQKFQANTQQAYQNVISAVGYKGLYQALGNDPSSISLAEQALGLSAGSLAAIAAIPNPAAQKAAVELQLSQTQLKQANLNLTQSTAEEPLKIKQLQAQINASNASAGSSAASTAKTKAETDFMNTHGGLTQAEYNTQQGEIQTATNTINKDAADLIGKMTAATNPISWQTAWNTLHAEHPDLDTISLDNLLQSQNYRK